MNELLPCPFCNSVNVVAQGDDGYHWYHVICNDCGGTCGEFGCDTRQKATDKWNKRSSQTNNENNQLKAELVDLKEHLLDQTWHKNCEIIPDYMPPNPDKDTYPRVVVRYNDGTKYTPFLRYSKGPKQCFFWDIYGDNMQTIALATIALSKAPYPRYLGPIVFSIPKRDNTEL